jgi:hypothetical protein
MQRDWWYAKVNPSEAEWQQVWVCAPSEVRPCYEIFLFSWSRLGEVFLFSILSSVTGMTVMMHRLINFGVMERKSTNNIGYATNENRHERDVEYEWTRKKKGTEALIGHASEAK